MLETCMSSIGFELVTLQVAFSVCEALKVNLISPLYNNDLEPTVCMQNISVSDTCLYNDV